jgi:hypothetical protein
MSKSSKLSRFKWLPVDALVVVDVLQNVINETSYDAIAQFFGCEPELFNTITSIIELARFFVLAHQGRKG